MSYLDQKPLKTAILSKFNTKTKKLHIYVINLGMYKDNYTVWCKWGYASNTFGTEKGWSNIVNRLGRASVQLKWICTSVIKAMVKYHDFINRYENKGYELVVMS